MPTKSDPAELGDVEPLADHTASQARRVVAAYANDADEASEPSTELEALQAENEDLKRSLGLLKSAAALLAAALDGA